MLYVGRSRVRSGLLELKARPALALACGTANSNKEKIQKVMPTPAWRPAMPSDANLALALTTVRAMGGLLGLLRL